MERRLLAREEVRGYGTGNHTFLEGQTELCAPEEPEHVVPLHVDNVHAVFIHHVAEERLDHERRRRRRRRDKKGG